MLGNFLGNFEYEKLHRSNLHTNFYAFSKLQLEFRTRFIIKK